MNETTNHYETIGILSNFEDGDESLKKKYRELCLKHHPDRNQGDAEAENKFKEVQEAYEILSDPIKRRSYDMETGFNPKVPKSPFGSSGARGGGFGGSGFPGGFNFEDLFGGRGVFNRQIVQNVIYELTFLDLYYGKTIEKELRLPNGKVFNETIIVHPRELIQRRAVRDIDETTSLIINFVPKLINDKKLISKDAFEIECDNDLNVVLIYKIPFITALKGQKIKRTILNKTTLIEIPKACKNGFHIEKNSLSLTRHSKFFISFIYDTPDISEEEIDQIESILVQ